MAYSLPNYFVQLIKKFPDILSGRKNQIKQNKRILKNLNLTKKYIKRGHKH